jgi:lipopolysaccharide exporter
MTAESSSPTGTVTRAALWTVAGRQLERVLGIASIAVTARLLLPSDFGLVGMAFSVLAMIEVFSSFGFDWALVRLKNPTREHFDTAFTLRVIFGLGTCATMCVFAYPAAAMYKDSRVVPLIVALGFASLLGSADNIGLAEFRRRLNFLPEFQIKVWSKLASLVACWGLAWATHSYWSLVGGIVAARLASVILSYRFSEFRPRLSLARRGDLTSFSIWFLAGNLVQALRGQFSQFYIGRVFGAHFVGVYGTANEFSAIASTEIAAPLNRAVFGRYAEMQGNRELLRQAFEDVSGFIWLLGLPAALGIGVCAPELVLVLLGARWADSAPLLQVLAIAGVFGVMAGNTAYVYWALGRSRLVLTLDLLAAVVFIGCTVAFARVYGVVGVAIAQCAASGLVLAVNYAVLRKTLDLSFAAMGARLWRIVVSAGVMYVGVAALRTLLSDLGVRSAIVRLSLLVPAGVVLYAIIVSSLWWVVGKPIGPEQKAAARLAAFLFGGDVSARTIARDIRRRILAVLR